MRLNDVVGGGGWDDSEIYIICTSIPFWRNVVIVVVDEKTLRIDSIAGDNGTPNQYIFKWLSSDVVHKQRSQPERTQCRR